MSNEEKVKVLKNPELRLEKIKSPVGRSMGELSDEELATIQKPS